MSDLSLRLNFQAAATGCRICQWAVVRDWKLLFAADDGCERQWHQSQARSGLCCCCGILCRVLFCGGRFGGGRCGFLFGSLFGHCG
ncbi:MAG: hypothetical protein ACK48U_16330, partial [Planctomyces sp.]